MSGPVTSVARLEDVQIFLKDPVYYLLYVSGKLRSDRVTILLGETEVDLQGGKETCPSVTLCTLTVTRTGPGAGNVFPLFLCFPWADVHTL